MAVVALVRKQLLGKEIEGVAIVPSEYRLGRSTQANTVEVIAVFTSAELDRNAIFLNNVTLSEIETLPTTTPENINATVTDNWVMVGVAKVQLVEGEYIAKFILNTNAGFSGVAAYCIANGFTGEIDLWQ